MLGQTFIFDDWLSNTRTTTLCNDVDDAATSRRTSFIPTNVTFYSRSLVQFSGSAPILASIWNVSFDVILSFLTYKNVFFFLFKPFQFPKSCFIIILKNNFWLLFPIRHFKDSEIQFISVWNASLNIFGLSNLRWITIKMNGRDHKYFHLDLKYFVWIFNWFRFESLGEMSE